MKFTDVLERDVTTEGAIFTKKIGMSANAKAFAIIFGQIYPDIIKAIVRELFANAWDSQKKAGNLDTPIDIHLPTSFEPWFSIRDYGTGMTPEVIDNVYSVVFESTKDTSNEEAGMFGMGSKTPFGYTDSFTVVSYVDGTLRAYNMYVDVSGDPEITQIAEEPTDEPNGVEVTLGVKLDDFNKFKEHAELFAMNAGTPVNINRQRYLKKREVVIEGNGWSLGSRGIYYDNTAYIRMGCILYKIDRQLAGIKNTWGSPAWQVLLHQPVIIDFEIGSFRVTGSREDIQYDNESRAKLQARAEEVVQDAINLFENEIRNAGSYAAAYRKYHEIEQYKLINDTKHLKDIEIDGFKIGDVDKFFTPMNMGVKFAFNNYPKRYKGTNIRPFASNSTEFVVMSNIYIDHHRLIYIFIDDDSVKNARTRISYVLSKVHHAAVHSYTRPRPRFFWVKTDDVANIETMLRYMPDNYMIIDVKDIDVPKQPRSKVARVDKAVTLCKNLNGRIGCGYLEEVEEGSYFVHMSVNKSFSDQAIAEISASLDVIGVSLKDVYAIPVSKEFMIEKHGLVDLIAEAKALRDKIDYTDEEYKIAVLSDINQSYSHKISSWVAGYYRHTMSRYEWSEERKELIKDLFGWEFDETKANPKFNRMINENVKNKYDAYMKHVVDTIEKLYDTYPILNYIQPGTIRSDAVKILEIVRKS